MIQNEFHHLFPHKKTSRVYTSTVLAVRENELKTQTPEEQLNTKAKHMKESIFSQIYLERCLTAGKVQSLSLMRDEDGLTDIWDALVGQFNATD